MNKIGTVIANQGRPLPFWFNTVSTPTTVRLGESSEADSTLDDKEVTTFTDTALGENVDIDPFVSYDLSQLGLTYSFLSDNPSEVAVDEFGLVTYAVPPSTDVSATISTMGTQGGVTFTRDDDVTLPVVGGGVVKVVTGGVSGSAREALTDVIDAAIAISDPVTQRDIFTTQDHASSVYVRNNSFFLPPLVESLTCASPWNSVGGRTRAGVAVTKRHAVLASHYRYGIGTVVRFVTSGNVVVERTVVQAGEVLQDSDVWMVLFDSDLPASITPCKLLPSDFEVYLPASAGFVAAVNVPLLTLNQYEETGVDEVLSISPNAHGIIMAHYGFPSVESRKPFYRKIVTGDSGDPIFAVIGTEAWLLSTFWGATGGPFYGGLVSELNAMINTLDTLQGDLTGYTVTEGDLSSYTTY